MALVSHFACIEITKGIIVQTILCFGDSFTYGEKDLSQGGWVERLKQFFMQEQANRPYLTNLVYNLGIASETTDGLCQRLQNEVGRRNLKNNQLVVFLQYGYNDIKIHKNKNLVPLKYFTRNLQSAFDYLHSVNAQIFVINMPPLLDELDGNIDQHNIVRNKNDVEAYNELIKQLCQKSNAYAIDWYSVFKQTDENQELRADDKVHLSSLGHQQLFELVKKQLLAELNSNE